MQAVIKTWATIRKQYLNFFDKYSLEQMNKVPPGFNNNLIWNIGHIIVVQQLLVYKGPNLPMYVSADLENLYKPGTKPTETTTQAEVDNLKKLLTLYVANTEDDFQKGLFTTYTERTTGTGFHLASVKDAFEFNNYHEAMHIGYMMSIRKFV